MDKVKDKALTFDDVLLVPAYSDFLPSLEESRCRQGQAEHHRKLVLYLLLCPCRSITKHF